MVKLPSHILVFGCVNLLFWFANKLMIIIGRGVATAVFHEAVEFDSQVLHRNQFSRHLDKTALCELNSVAYYVEKEELNLSLIADCVLSKEF